MTKAVRVADVVDYVEELAPVCLAEQWDNVGLQVGSPQAVVKAIVVALDVDDAVVDEAVRLVPSVIVTHHPLLFEPAKKVLFDAAPGRYLTRLCRESVSLVVAHTNLDKVAGGVSDRLMNLLGVEDAVALRPDGRLYKLVVFVPEADGEKVRRAIGDAGSGLIGNYSHCSFAVEGTGRFTPLPGAEPALGEIGREAAVGELRVEFVVPEDKLDAALGAMLAAHPYEEVAYDVYPLRLRDERVGLGRVGRLSAPTRLADLCETMSGQLGTSCRFAGDAALEVTKVAVCGGSGSSLIDDAISKGAQVLITGDVRYHDRQSARERGLALIDAGHADTEWPIIPYLAERFTERFGEAGLQVKVVSQSDGWQ